METVPLIQNKHIQFTKTANRLAYNLPTPSLVAQVSGQQQTLPSVMLNDLLGLLGVDVLIHGQSRCLHQL